MDKRFIAECGQEPVPDRGGLDQRVYSQSAGDWKSNDHPRRVDTDEQPEGRRRNAASHLDANEKMLEEHHQAEGQKNDRESYSEKTAPEGYDYTRSFADQIDDWVAGKIPTNDTLVLGPTPEVFQKIGLSALPMTIDQKHIDYAVNSTKNEDHNLELEMLKKLPEMMENPVAIIESDSKPTDSAVVILRGKVSGKQHIAAVHISGNGKINGLRIDTNHLASTYGRKNAISKLLTDAIKKENANQVGIFYWQKVAARTLFVESGEQFPGGAMQDGHIHSIYDANSPVKMMYEDYKEQKDTWQFKRWFGKSKMVDSDRNPKILYRNAQTNGEEGLRLTERKKGTDLQALYVRMEKPLSLNAQGKDTKALPTTDAMQKDGFKESASIQEIALWAAANGYDGLALDGVAA